MKVLDYIASRYSHVSNLGAIHYVLAQLEEISYENSGLYICEDDDGDAYLATDLNQRIATRCWLIPGGGLYLTFKELRENCSDDVTLDEKVFKVSSEDIDDFTNRMKTLYDLLKM